MEFGAIRYEVDNLIHGLLYPEPIKVLYCEFVTGVLFGLVIQERQVNIMASPEQNFWFLNQ
jgi:hypothetical protein